jgi:ABC-type multidrug transport system permease subunit
MKALKVIWGLVSVMVIGPIWYYLLYKILQAVDASELMWFLYWIYLPTAFFMGVLNSIISNSNKKGE